MSKPLSKSSHPRPARLAALLCGLCLALSSTLAAAACSPYLGRATINEINKSKSNGNDDATDFVEIKILDSNISQAVYSTWSFTIQEDGGQGPTTFPLSDFEDLSRPWLVQSGLDIAIYIDFNAGMNVILRDNQGKVIDYLDYLSTDGFTALADPSCTAFIYDTTADSGAPGGVKRIGRTPDGSGDWGTVQAQSTDPTEDTTNDVLVGPAATIDAVIDSVTVAPGANAVFTVTLTSASPTTGPVTINFRTADNTAENNPPLPGVSDYTAQASGSLTIPAGASTGTISISTNITAAAGEIFYVLINSVDAVVQTTLGTATFAAAGNSADYFTLSHDNNGIYCLQESISIDAYNSAGQVVQAYEGEVTLNSGSSAGTWRVKTIAGNANGTFADATTGDGLATYKFATTDLGHVEFWFDYTSGAPPLPLASASLDVDVYETGATNPRDNDLEGNLVFSPSGFTLTASVLSNPPPATINNPVGTQTAAINFPLHLAAYGQTPADPSCGIIETYTGGKNLAFWFDYNNPGSGTLVPSIDTNPIATAAGATQVVTFNAGQASVSVNYKDVGQLTLHAADGSISGATNPFVVRPADLVVTAITSPGGTSNPAAASATGGGFVASGTAFTTTVEVRNADGGRTPNFGLESPAEGLTLKAATLVVPAGGRNGSADNGALANATIFSSIAPAGTFRGTQFSWDEYGIITLQASVTSGTYMGTGPLLGTPSGNVGRFTVDSYVLISGSASGACNNNTYMDQPALSLSYALEARGNGTNVLFNYDRPLLGSGGVSLPVVQAENNNSGTNLGGRLSNATTAWSNGRYALTTTSASFARLAAADGPYTTLQLSMAIVDLLDSRVISSPNTHPTTSTDCIAATDCSAVSIGAPTAVVYGRLEVANALGAETEPLDVGLSATYFDDSGNFIPQQADDCSSYINTGATLGNYQGGLPVLTVIAPTTASLLVKGEAAVIDRLYLAAPGAGNTGSVDVTYDAPAWLEYDWLGTGVQDPLGTASFGQFRGHDRVIYWREVY